MAVLSLPLSFTNSFWSQDYRKGLEVLYKKLEQGVAENDEIIAFIRSRAVAEGQIAAALEHPHEEGTGFNTDDGATLLMAFRGLQAETAKQGEVHRTISHELHTLVADPFQEWATGYRERLRNSKHTLVDGYLRNYEHSQGEVVKLKNTYLAKVRKADEAEDDAKFAPGSEIQDKYTTSPRLGPQTSTTAATPGRPAPQRGSSISERIAQRLKDIQRRTASATAAPDAVKTDAAADDSSSKADEKEGLLSKVDKGKGKAVDLPEVPPQLSVSPPPLSPPLPPSKLGVEIPSSPMPAPPPEPMLLAGLSLPRQAISSLLTRAAAELPLRPVRFPLLGEYPDCFTGEEFVVWLNENVQGFGGSLDRAEDAAKDLTEREGLLRRVGEFGNMFESSDDAFYQFRPKAFELDKTVARPPDAVTSPQKMTPVTENIMKRGNNFFSVVTKALNANGQAEPPHVRARAEAEAADKTYRVAVRKLDRQRLGLEERMEEMFKTLQKWEVDRLRAVKTVLLQYHGTLSNLPRALEPSLERSNTLISAYLPEADLNALIERHRTGPFRPHPQLYESVSHDESDVVFGIDLRKWYEGGWSMVKSGEERKEVIPPVLTALLEALNTAYPKIEKDDEKRRTWIYEVPLPAVHHLRESINAIEPEQPIPSNIFEKYDAPVLASTVKLWCLELDPPLGLWEGWEEIRRIYPTVGSAVFEDAAAEAAHLEQLQAALQRLPKVHLFVLNAIISHLRQLIESTNAEESDEVYITKLALSIGRTVLRPKFETEISIQDRHPAMLFIDLMKFYDKLLPPTIAKKKRESERKMPIRKRTAPIDMRMSRSRLSVGTDARDWLAAQRVNGSVPPPVPPVPSKIETGAPPPTEAKDTPPIPAPEKTEEPAEAENTPVSSVPAPEQPPVQEFVSPPPPAPEQPPIVEAAAPEVVPSDEPARPSFREPPPELDDLPPRPPAFKEPDLGDVSPPPPRPTFAEPIESKDEVDIKSPASATFVSPSDTPTSPASPAVRVRTPLSATSPSARKFASRSPSPPGSAAEDQPIGGAGSRVSLSRNTSAEAGRVRGPRGSRPPRTGGGGSVSNMVANLNRTSMVGNPPASPGARATSPPGSAKGRPASSLIEERRRSLNRMSGGAGAGGARTGSLSRRTMESDAEDNIVG